MPSKLAEVTSRNFNPMLAPGLSDETRKAVKAAFDAMSTWRTEIVNDNENESLRRLPRLRERLDGLRKSPRPPARKCKLSTRCSFK